MNTLLFQPLKHNFW